jgi:hypothetical protein
LLESYEYRNGVERSYAVPADRIAEIWEARQQAQTKWRENLLRVGAIGGQIIGRRMQHEALMRESRDCYGNLQAFSIQPEAVECSDCSCSIEGGPQMMTYQWSAFIPSSELQPELDLCVWRPSSDFVNLSLDTLIEEGKQF